MILLSLAKRIAQAAAMRIWCHVLSRQRPASAAEIKVLTSAALTSALNE